MYVWLGKEQTAEEIKQKKGKKLLISSLFYTQSFHARKTVIRVVIQTGDRHAPLGVVSAAHVKWQCENPPTVITNII